MLHTLQTNIKYIVPKNIDAKVCPKEYTDIVRGRNCLGGSISKDIKNAVIPFLDSLDDSAKSLQSVNTVIHSKQGGLIGHNTDIIGFKEAIVKGIEQSGVAVVKKAICYGYGGVTNVAAVVLTKMGIELYISGRNADKILQRSQELSNLTSTVVLPWNENIQADLFINAAPVTDKDLSEAHKFLESLKGCKIAFDHEMPGTNLKNYCKENGIHYISGYDMYYPQMIAQWSLFLGKELSRDEIQLAEEIAGEKMKSI
jgi:shikimate 5-dehydrogenase